MTPTHKLSPPRRRSTDREWKESLDGQRRCFRCGAAAETSVEQGEDLHGKPVYRPACCVCKHEVELMERF